jgi:hypothetical protein
MFNVNRRAIACVFMLAVMCMEWTLYSSDQIQPIRQNDLPMFPIQHHLHQQSFIDYWTPQQPELYHLIENYSKDRLPLLAKDDPPFKRILFWNKVIRLRRHIHYFAFLINCNRLRCSINQFYSQKSYRVGLGRDALRQWGCPVWQCETSDNRYGVRKYDAVVFHQRTWTAKDLPMRRSPHQRYVFFTLESSAWRGNNVSRVANFFNWTMTYRWDSDMIYPYGYITPTGNVPLHPTPNQMKFYLSKPTRVNYAKGKTKMAAWFVSNCHTVVSGRNEMVKELQKYMTIDVYGKCGKFKCRKKLGEDNSSDECRDMVAKNYKFYFALENSLCRHYVTEKYVDI